MTDADPALPSNDPPIERRSFLKSTACTLLGGACVAGPIGAGVMVLIQPLRQKGPPVEVRLTTVDFLPLGGPPKFFQIVTDRRDAWTQFPMQAIGSVFLLRRSENEVVAFNAACPHLGCAVEFVDARKCFYCPCHDSSFANTGEVMGASPSRRGLDTLEVVLKERDVWVRFQNFEAGKAEKIPTA